MKAGKEFASKGIFKKPDWEKAAMSYRDAVKHYRMAGAAYNAQFIEALRASATAHREIGSLNAAAIDLEKAAAVAKEEKDIPLAVTLYKESSRYYRANEQPDKASGLLVLAANTSEVPAESMALFNEACDMVQEEKKALLFEDVFTKAIIFAIKTNQLDAALALIARENIMYEQDMDRYTDSLWKNFLHSMVILFHQGKYTVAEQQFRDSEAKHPEFAATEYYGAGLGLLGAMENGDLEELKAVVDKGTFKYLNNQCARLAKNLTFTPALLAEKAEAKRAAAPPAPGEGVDGGPEDLLPLA